MIETYSTDLADRILGEIKKANHILLHCHPSPDADSIGSTLAMKHAITSMGKEVTLIAGDSPLPTYLSTLPGFNTIVTKNLFEVDLAAYDLFLILDSAALGQISRKGTIIFPPTLQTIVIDHHKTNPGFASINLIDDSYPATCQIVFDLLSQWNISITPDIALNLFAGIYTDTGGFKYRGTTYKTIAIASKLAEIAPDFTKLLFVMDNSNTKERLMLEGALLSSIESWFGDSVAVASVSHEFLSKNNIGDNEISGAEIANTLKSVVNWNIGISMVEKEPGIVKMSFRTRDADRFDVSKVAVLLGGGGHMAAAGAAISGNLEEVKQKVKQTLEKAYPALKV